jgi:hypothetical protein
MLRPIAKVDLRQIHRNAHGKLAENLTNKHFNYGKASPSWQLLMARKQCQLFIYFKWGQKKFPNLLSKKKRIIQLNGKLGENRYNNITNNTESSNQ